MINRNWLDFTTGLFNCVAQNNSEPRTFREIIFSGFGIPHKWFYKKNEWISGRLNDLETIIQIRKGQIDKATAKQTLQCFTPSAYYKCKKKGSEVIEHYNPILQLDFDGLENYDLSEVKSAIFNLPFVAFVSRSVSGAGLFALILIEEPEKLKEYAIHCFEVFKHYGLSPDKTKGRNYSDLRYVSYDSEMLYRENPTPLKINNFYTPPVKEFAPVRSIQSKDGLVKWAIREIQATQVGKRFEVVRRVSYYLGGHSTGLDEMKAAITNSPQYAGEENEFLRHADNGFKDGSLKPIAA